MAMPRVTVFASSTPNTSPNLISVSTEFGRLLAERGCVGVFGGGATLGLLLAKGAGGGGGGGGANGSGAAAAAGLQPPPSAAALVESYHLSPQLAELIAAPCDTQSVVQLQARPRTAPRLAAPHPS